MLSGTEPAPQPWLLVGVCFALLVFFFFFVSIRAVPNGEKWNLSIVLTFISLLATVNSSCLWNEFVWLRTESVAPTRAGL